MKKVLILCLVLLFVGLTTAAFAATSYPSGNYGTDSFDVGGTTSMTVKTSKNVYMQVSISGSNPAFNYSEAAYHTAGSRTFGTSNADQKLFFYEGTGISLQAAPATAGTAPDWTGNGWQVL